ncbi:type 1 periplasmic binding fold superfamily protein [Flavobacterium sp. RHBU_24]|uniref:type 1 periplasmic binding fold superfamily protein n=1 Tax=Flavobacterium sp. RHBU_24 TaxID=3391185 RepID=UPI00398557A8
MKNLKLMAIAAFTIVSLSACSDDDTAQPVNEEEVITTVTATFTPQGGGSAITLASRDLDGDGPDAPVVTASGSFTAGTAYNGTITFLNELSSPADNITEEVEEEGEDHQVFFQQSGLGTFTYTDADADGKPIGLAFTYTAAAAPTTGTLTVTLRHLPNKSAANVAAGDITNAGGATDAEVTYNVTIQ